MFNLKFDIERIAKAIIFICAALVPLFLVYCQNGLFADGSYALYLLTKVQTFFTFGNDSRQFANFLSQSMVITAIKLGVSDNQTLIFLHSFNLIMVPAAVWWLGLFRSRHEVFFWPFVVLYSTVFLNGSFMSIGEFNFAYAFMALVAVVLLKSKALAITDIIILVFSAFFLTRAYEAMLLIGPLLIMLSLRRLRRESIDPAIAKAIILISCGLFGYGIFPALDSISNHRHPENLKNALNFLANLDNKQLLMSLCIGVLYSLSLWSKKQRVLTLIKIISFTLLLIFLFWQLWAMPGQHYQARSVLAGVLGFGLLFLFMAREQKLTTPTWPIPLALFLCLQTPLLYHGVQFRSFVEAFRKEISGQTGEIPLEETSLNQSLAYTYGWMWAFPVMSKVLGQSPQDAVIQNPRYYRGWAPEL